MLYSVSRHVDSDIDVLYEMLTAQIGVGKKPFAHYALGVGDFKAFFLIYLVVTHTLILDYRTLLDLSSDRAESWRRYTLKGVCWCQGRE